MRIRYWTVARIGEKGVGEAAEMGTQSHEIIPSPRKMKEPEQRENLGQLLKDLLVLMGYQTGEALQTGNREQKHYWFLEQKTMKAARQKLIQRLMIKTPALHFHLLKQHVAADEWPGVEGGQSSLPGGSKEEMG